MNKILINEKDKIYRDIVREEYGVSDEAINKIEAYFCYLNKWGRTFNLVSRGTMIDFLNRHVIDSLQIMDKVKGNTVLDIGTGAGFPGMVLAMCTNLEVTCIDSDMKKTLFLEEMARGIGVKNVRIINQRIEKFKEKFDTVTARAFTSLVKLVSFAEMYSGYGVFLKGKTVTEEIEKARNDYSFKYELFDSKTDPNGKVITISSISKKRTKNNGEYI